MQENYGRQGSAAVTSRAEEIRDRLLGNDRVRQKVAIRAYEIYQERGCEPGRDFEDWAQAEYEILTPLVEEEMTRPAVAGGEQKMPQRIPPEQALSDASSSKRVSRKVK